MPSKIIGFLALAIGALVSLSLQAQVTPPDMGLDPIIDWPMYVDPKLTVSVAPPDSVPGLYELWVQASRQPDADTRRRAAEAFGTARLRQMPGVIDAGRDVLTGMLELEDQYLLVKSEAVRSLVRFFGPPPQVHADYPALQAIEPPDNIKAVLLRHNQSGGIDMILLTDPTLALWRYAPALEVWRARLDDSAIARSARVSAIESLATVGDAQAAPALLKIVVNRDNDAGLRLVAARSAGNLVSQGLVEQARALAQADNATLVDRLAAVYLLNKHTDADTQELLATLALSPEPPLALAAGRRLLELSPALVRRQIAPSALQNADANLRLLGLDALKHEPDATAVELASAILDDPNPQVRRAARDLLIQFAGQSSLRDAVIRSGMAALGGQAWRALEQAALLLGRIDHKPAAPKMAELLSQSVPSTDVSIRPGPQDVNRHEVRMALIVGLRWLAIPETFPAMLSYAQERSQNRAKIMVRNAGNTLKDTVQNDIATARYRIVNMEADAELTHLLQAFGLMKYMPADPLLMSYVGKGAYAPWEHARTAAIWSLGHLHAGSANAGLSGTLIGRLSDVAPPQPESPLVRQFCAVSIGRIKAPASTTALASFLGNATDPIGKACNWALEQITGKRIPEAPIPAWGGTWFLSPRPKDRPSL